MMVFMPLVVVYIGQFCPDMIGRRNMKVAVIGQLLFCCYYRSSCIIIIFYNITIQEPESLHYLGL